MIKVEPRFYAFPHCITLERLSSEATMKKRQEAIREWLSNLNLLYNRDFVTYYEGRPEWFVQTVWAFKEDWPVLQFKLTFYAWQD